MVPMHFRGNISETRPNTADELVVLHQGASYVSQPTTHSRKKRAVRAGGSADYNRARRPLRDGR